LDNLDLMRRTMVLTDAATALRVSEVLALKWNDLDFTDHLIQVRRAYVDRRFGPPKSKASKAPVPMHPLLAAHLLAWRKETLYPSDDDFVFPSLRLKGKKPPVANMLVRGSPACGGKKSRGGCATPRLWLSHLPEDLGLRIGENESRRQDRARASSAPKLATTLELYAKSMSEDRLKAQGMFLELLFSHRREEKLATGLLH
jgi:integrase